MNVLNALAVAVGGYLIGSISFARIFGRLMAPEEDISTTEFDIPQTDKKFTIRSVSAMSLAFRKGPRVGCLVSIADMLKAFIPTFILWRVYPDGYYHLIVGAATMAGHNFPIYYRFKGGRGISSLYGSLLVIDWMAIPVTMLAGTVLGLVMLRELFFAYTGWILFLIPWIWYRYPSWPYITYAFVVNIIFWSAMVPEIKAVLSQRKDAKEKGEETSMSYTDFRKLWMGRKEDSAQSELKESTAEQPTPHD